MKKSSAQKGESPSQLIGARIEELGDWRGKTLSRLRGLIKKADPEVVEEWKWRKPSNRGSGVVSPRSDLHRRDVQERRETHVLQGGLAEGPFGTVQLEPRRQHPARNRLPRGR